MSTRARRTALAIALAIGATSVRAQSRTDYASLVRMYLVGDGVNAINNLLQWPQADVIAGSKAAVVDSPQQRIAAAILHTEAALSLVDGRPFDAAFHVEIARTLLHGAARDPAAHERADAVLRRWYYFVAAMFTSAAQMAQASWYIREGLLEFPREAPLYVVRGTIPERTVQVSWNGAWRREPPVNLAERTRVDELLKRAVDDHQRAIRIDSHLALAHLHIGWIRLYLGDSRARPELDAAVANATSEHVRYLGHLFLGGLAEHEKQLDVAQREYEQALAAGRAFQTPYLALSRIEDALGNTTRAREIAATCAQLLKDQPDPWWDFGAAFDRDALIDLRAEARRP